MIAISDKSAVRVEVRVASGERNPGQEINSPAFLKALLDGPPTAERAFGDLVRHLRLPLTRFIGRWLRDPEAIEDAVQETFLAVHRSLPRFEGKSRLTTWVYSLARHKAMDMLAEKYRPDGCDQARETLWEPETSDPRPDELAHQTLLIARINSAADCLPDLYREAWRMRDMEGMSGEEAADALGITATLVRVRLHRARNLIGERLRRDWPGLFSEAQ